MLEMLDTCIKNPLLYYVQLETQRENESTIEHGDGMCVPDFNGLTMKK